MPYTTSTSDGKVTVFKKVGGHKKVVGHTTPGKKNAYLAALHIHSKDKDRKNEGAGYGYDDQVGQVFLVQKPYDGCQPKDIVHQFDPISGIQGMGFSPDQVHGMYLEENVALQMAEAACKQYMEEAIALEEKKTAVGEKIKKAIDKLEKKRKEHIDLAKEDPKSAAQHKDHIAQLATKIDDFMTKLEKIEKSKKEIKKDEDKKGKK